MKKWIIGTVLAASLCVGCSFITVAQQDKIDNLSSLVMSLQDDYSKLNAAISKVVAQMMTGEVPVEEGAELLKTIQEEQKVIEGKIRSAQVDIQSLTETGANPWVIAGSVLLNLALGYAGIKYKGIADIARTVATTVISGVEAAGSIETKQSVARIAKLNGVSPVVDTYVQNVVKEIPK